MKRLLQHLKGLWNESDRPRRATALRPTALELEPLEERALLSTSGLPDLAGNTLAAARDVGVVRDGRTFADHVHGSLDANDYYRFSLPFPNTVTLRLSALRADADLQLLDRNGREVARSANRGVVDDTLSRVLAADTYFARVFPNGRNTATDYRLTVSPQVLLPDAAGNDRARAHNLGLLVGPRAVADYVGPADRADYYRFELDRSSDLRLELLGLRADADVILYTAGGRERARSAHGGPMDTVISTTLSSGTYFVAVVPYRGASTPYTLTFDPRPVVLEDDPAGNDRATALDLGLLSSPRTVNGRVSPGDLDFYRFAITGRSDVRLRLGALRANADLYLYDADGRVLDISAQVGTSDDVILRTLGAGTYYVAVVPYRDARTPYTLTLSSEPAGSATAPTVTGGQYVQSTIVVWTVVLRGIPVVRTIRYWL